MFYSLQKKFTSLKKDSYARTGHAQPRTTWLSNPGSLSTGHLSFTFLFKISIPLLGIEVYAFNPNMQQAEVGGSL